MTTKAVQIGASINLDFTFKDAAAALTDPTTIALVIREPDGVEIVKTQADMVKQSTGVWRYVHAVTKRGRHVARADGDGAADGAGSVDFYAPDKGTS